MTQTQDNTKEKPDGGTQDRVKSLQKDASRVLQDISELSAKLREVGTSKLEEVSSETVAILQKQLADLEEKTATLNIEGKKILSKLDKSIKANPYLWILGALGLGLLLGKSIRSQDPK